MSTVDLTSLIAAAEDDALIWSVFARHADRSVEVHGYDGNAAALDPDMVGRELAHMSEISHVLGDEPLDCDTVSKAGIQMLARCRRCRTL